MTPLTYIAEPITTPDDLVESAVYELITRADHQRRDRRLVGVFLGTGGFGRGGNDLMFSCRPLAGTQQIPRSWFRRATMVPRNTPPRINEIVRQP